MDSDGARFAEIPEMTSFLHYFRLGLPCMRALAQDLVLDLEKTSFNRGGAPQPPQQTREPKDNSRSTAVSAS
jgi:hypothetical protein